MSEERNLVKVLIVGAGIFGFSQAEAWLKAHRSPQPEVRPERAARAQPQPEPAPAAPMPKRRRRRRRTRQPPLAKLPDLAPTIPDRLDDAAIRRTVAAHHGELAACYRQSRTEKLALRVTVQPSGKVSHVETDGGRESRCAMRRIRRWRFPKFRGEPRQAALTVILAGGP